jgi:TolB-like protein/Tfp pilus assembly protein PilF
MTQDSPNQITSGRDAFVSYASHDAAVAQKVCLALEAGGYPCWIAPRDVVPGTLYADGIVGAIDESSILVLILSEQAIASAHVGRELERAASKRHPIIALRTDTAPLTRAFEYFLNQSQWIEGGGSDAAIAKLVEAVGRHLAPGTTPVSGQDPRAPQAPVRKTAMPRRVWLIAGAIIAFMLAAGYFVAEKTRLSKQAAAKHETTSAPANISDKSIAVLPFADMSEKKDQEYFADGMAEEIIDLLVKIPGLKVISRTSSFQFKGKTEDLHSIGTQLGVAYVLQGSVRKSGDRLRVTAQLLNSRDGADVWSETYDRDLSDVLKMQDEIAIALVRALQIEVGAGIFSRPALRNTEAYTVYLQGLHALDGQNQPSTEKALRDFQRALDLDPSFADAAAKIGVAYGYLGQFGFMPPAVAYEKSRQSTDLALRLDSNLAGAHALLGFIHFNYDGDWAAAERELKLARSLAPNDASVLFVSSLLSGRMGRSDEALTFLSASMGRDPLFAGAQEALGHIQLRSGRLAEAETSFRRALELDPTSAFGHYNLGSVFLARSQPDAALAEYLKETVDVGRIGGSAMAYFALGREADSNVALAQMIKDQAQHPFLIAEVYAFRGETDEALKWLDRPDAQTNAGLTLVGNPSFNKLRADPRFKAFLRKMNLPE